MTQESELDHSLMSKISKLSDAANNEPTSWIFALSTTVKGVMAVVTLVTLFMHLSPNTNYTTSPPSGRCVKFFDQVAGYFSDAPSKSDIVAYNYDAGTASVRVCTSDAAYWNSRLGSKAYDPFAFLHLQFCNGTTKDVCTIASNVSNVVPCDAMHTAANNWLYGLFVSSNGDKCDIQYDPIEPPLPPCPRSNSVLSFEETNANVQMVLNLLIIVPLFAFLGQTALAFKYSTVYSLKAPDESEKDNCISRESIAFAMEGIPGSLLQLYYLMERFRGQGCRYIPQFKLSCHFFLLAQFQNLLELAACAISLFGCTGSTISHNHTLLLDLVTVCFKSVLFLYTIKSYVTEMEPSSSAPDEVLEMQHGSVAQAQPGNDAV